MIIHNGSPPTDRAELVHFPFDDHSIPCQRFRYPALQQGQGFENIGGQTLFWYGSWSARSGVRVASWPQDRLGYFEAFKGSKMRSLQKAQFVTAPVELGKHPTRVTLNLDGLSAHASVTVAVLDAHFRPCQAIPLPTAPVPPIRACASSHLAGTRTSGAYGRSGAAAAPLRRPAARRSEDLRRLRQPLNHTP